MAATVSLATITELENLTLTARVGTRQKDLPLPLLQTFQVSLALLAPHVVGLCFLAGHWNAGSSLVILRQTLDTEVVATLKAHATFFNGNHFRSEVTLRTVTEALVILQ